MTDKDPAPQVPAMVTSGASGQNLEVDRAAIQPVTAGATLCDEGLAGGSNPAVAGPADTPRTNEFFASCEKVTGWNHVYSKQAAFCRTLERELAEAKEQRGALAYSSHEGGWTPLGEIIVRLERNLAAKQEQVDRLMLEYCPDEMTPEQVENWRRHQIAVDE